MTKKFNPFYGTIVGCSKITIFEHVTDIEVHK